MGASRPGATPRADRRRARSSRSIPSPSDSSDSPSVAAAANGDFVVVWQTYPAGVLLLGGDTAKGASRASASPRTDRRRAASSRSTATRRQRPVDPAVAAASDGDFVVLWTSQGDRTGPTTSSASRAALRLGRIAVGAQFQINTYTTERPVRSLPWRRPPMATSWSCGRALGAAGNDAAPRAFRAGVSPRMGPRWAASSRSTPTRPMTQHGVPCDGDSPWRFRRRVDEHRFPGSGSRAAAASTGSASPRMVAPRAASSRSTPTRRTFRAFPPWPQTAGASSSPGTASGRPDRTPTKEASRASATPRTGRCGRAVPGQ